MLSRWWWNKTVMWRQAWTMQGWKHVLWMIHQILLNPWRCHFCHNRGCSPMDFPDGSTLWRCCVGGCGEYWEEHDGTFRSDLETFAGVQR